MPDNSETQPDTNRPNAGPEGSIRKALQAIADRIADGSNLTVVTSVQVVDTTGQVRVDGQKVEIARTEISIDGDRTVVVPITLEANELSVPDAVYKLHAQQVTEAAEYRKQMLETLVNFVRTRRLG